MNDGRSVMAKDENFPIPAELLAKDSLHHRYYKDGQLLSVEQLLEIEQKWKQAREEMANSSPYHGKISKDLGF